MMLVGVMVVVGEILIGVGVISTSGGTALMVILMILKQDSKDKDIVTVVMFGVMAMMMGLTMVAVGVEILGVGVVMVIVIMMVIVMVMVVLVFRYHKESGNTCDVMIYSAECYLPLSYTVGSPTIQAAPEVSNLRLPFNTLIILFNDH